MDGPADGGVRRQVLRRQVIVLVAMVLFGLFMASWLGEDTVGAEWGRAFGVDHPVTGTVARVVPSVGATRACTLDGVVLVWSVGPIVRTGSFDVCSDEDRDYPTGRRVSGWAPTSDAANDPVGVNLESRAGAWFGVVLDSLSILAWLAVFVGVLLFTVRMSRAPAVLFRRPATTLRVFGNEPTRNSNRRVGLAGADGVRLLGTVTARRDRETLAEGVEVTAIRTGRSLFRRRPVGPVVLVRKGDGQLFWSTTLRPQ